MLIDEGMLKIQDKDRKLVRYIPKTFQKKLNDIIYKAYMENVPVKIVCVKCRQCGFSTASAAPVFCITCQQPNTHSYIVADIEDHANNLFEKTKLFHEELQNEHPHLCPRKRRSNARVLEFDELRSYIKIASAENRKAARSGTYHAVLLTEADYFPDLEKFLEGLQIPKEGFSLMIIESTAAQYGSAFHALYSAAVSKRNAFVPLFVAWFEEPGYAMALLDGQMYSIDGIEFDTRSGAEDFLKEEEELKKRFGINDEQLNWRRFTIINDCNRKVKTFRQEYPSTWQEAFQFTGGCRFDTLKLKEQLERKVKPLERGRLIDESGMIKFVKDSDGPYEFFHFPEPWMKCVVGGDAAQGEGETHDRDYQAMCVIDRCFAHTLATFHTRDMDDDHVAIEAIKLSRFYNQAILAFESYPSAHGYGIMKYCCTRYGACHMHTVEDEKSKRKTCKFGWKNTHQSREEAIEIFSEDLREGCHLNSETIINEAMTFVRDPITGRSEHIAGAHDDLLFARMIAGKLRRLYPATYKSPESEKQDYKHANQRKKNDRISLDNI
jgi:hypothetical protein